MSTSSCSALAAPCLGDDLPKIDPDCRASVIVPARNEEDSLESTLDALRLQVESNGSPLSHPRYETLLLLNNCTDRSSAIAHRYARRHPAFRLHVIERELAPHEAHVGTARRILMDIACERLEALDLEEDVHCAILSTDADTLVAPDWISQNLAQMELGADAVGGKIHLSARALDQLGVGTRLYYERDCELQHLVAQLESLLDPDPADPWPRHLHHFGASLACTPAIYRASGGLPPVKPLEDIAFVDALRKVGARIRHSPTVNIVTSSRLAGRAEVGLSGQLRLWTEEHARAVPQMVDSAEWMMHRFRMIAALRRVHQDETQVGIDAFPASWHRRIRQCCAETLATPRFLERLDCNALIEEMFSMHPGKPPRRGEITSVIQRLKKAILTVQFAPAHRS